jgi:hypothetical protein
MQMKEHPNREQKYCSQAKNSQCRKKKKTLAVTPTPRSNGPNLNKIEFEKCGFRGGFKPQWQQVSIAGVLLCRQKKPR